MTSNHQYLEKHGDQWRVQKKVPKNLRSILGKAKLVAPLHTDSLVIANRKKWAVLQEFDAQLASAEARLRNLRGTTDPLVIEALEFKEELSRARQSEAAHPDDDLWEKPKLIESLIQDRTMEILSKEGSDRASTFNGVALGSATPMHLLIDDWLAEKPMKPRQKIDYSRAVKKLAIWLSSNRLPSGVEELSRKLAGRYVSKAFVAAGVHPRTANKDISCLSSFWRWLVSKGYVEENIWREQSIPEPRLTKDEGKRPFTDVEMKTLLAGNAHIYLHDSIRIGALTGMRIDEIARMKVEDISNGLIEIKKAKTPAGERTIPIHSALREIFTKRCEGKMPSDYLFPELPTPRPNSPIERSQKTSKAFTRYRRSLGVDDRIEGARQSRVDFHSFRRWFITKAKDALNEGVKGYSHWTIAQVVGHGKDDGPLAITMGRYAGDDTLKAMRACVEAVRLPE